MPCSAVQCHAVQRSAVQQRALCAVGEQRSAMRCRAAQVCATGVLLFGAVPSAHLLCIEWPLRKVMPHSR